MAGTRKVVQIPTHVATDFQRYVLSFREQDFKLSDSEVVGAALIAFWELPRDQQLDAMRRVHAYKFDRELKAWKERTGDAGDSADELAKVKQAAQAAADAEHRAGKRGSRRKQA